MEFMNGLFGGLTCNPDGSIGQNAFTGLIDRSIESNFLEGHIVNEGQVAAMQFMETDRLLHHELHDGTMTAIQSPQLSMMAMPFMPYHYPHMLPYVHDFHHLRDRDMHHEHVCEVFEEMDDGVVQADVFMRSDQSMLENLIDHDSFIDGTTIVIDADDLDQHTTTRNGSIQAWNILEENLQRGILTEDVNYTVTSDGRVYCFEHNNSYMDRDSKSDLEKLFETGMEFYKVGRIQSAIEVFEAIVQQANDNDSVNIAESWRMLGLCHTENDEDKSAILCYIKAVDHDQYHLDALLALGTCYMNELDSTKALETLKAWVTHNPQFSGLEVPQDEYSDGSLMDEVMQLMLAVANYAPGDINVQVVLGVIYNISSDYSNAVDCFRRALSKDPGNFNLLNKLAATLANGGRSEEALPIYAKALQNRPNFARAWMNLGISYSNLNLFGEGAKAYVQALHLSPKAKHIWGYLRVVLNNMDRTDLVELSAREKVNELAALLKVELIQKK